MFTLAVEGLVDEAVARKLVVSVGGSPGLVYGLLGKANLLNRLSGFNHGARNASWFVLADLDHDGCAPDCRRAWLPEPSAGMCFRIAVREVEAWLLADRTELADFLGVSATRIPRDPEGLDDPKAALVGLAQRSRRRALREDLVPRVGSGRPVGPAYSSRIGQFVSESWRPEVAGEVAGSLGRTLERLRSRLPDAT